MDYRLLGPLEVIGDGGMSIPIPAPKRRALLAALLLEANRPVSPARLSEALWGDAAPPTAGGSLQAHVSRLRHELGPDRILTQPAGYLVVVAAEELDVRRFEDALTTATRAATLGAWREAADAFERAMGQWRGPALADISSSGYLETEVVRLDELRLTAMEGQIEADLALGLHTSRMADLAELIEQNPLRERFWQQWMLALYRSGRQADALAAYRRLRVTLVGELGIDPSPELQLLEGRILRQDPALDGPIGGSGQSLYGLPLPLTSLIGRANELERAVAILRTHRLLTLTGPGGVGKTRLAIHVAHTMLGEFSDGVMFVDLARTRIPADVIPRIGASIGGGERPAGVIGDRRVLLVLDNFEQVVEAAPAVAELLELCPRLRVLVTSRAPLRIGAERYLEVPPLSRSDGIVLFEERSQAALVTAAWDDAVLGDIVSRLDGLPLAIELAAARLRVLSAATLRDRLTERLPLLTAGPRDAPQRHRTLRETIAWSYDLLSPTARGVFRALSVPAAGFDLGAALVIGDTDLTAIAELVDHSLVRRIDDRYSMLETIHEFAVERAAGEGETSSARDRHLAHYLTVAEATRRGTTEGGPRAGNAWVVMCMTERENLRVAFEWAIERDDEDAILRLFRATGLFWLMAGAIEDGQRWGEVAAAAGRRLKDPARLLPAVLVLSEYPRFSGEPRRALDLKSEALELAGSGGDIHLVAVILDDMASIHAGLGDLAMAHRLLDEAMAIHDSVPSEDPLDRAHTVLALIELAIHEGDPVLADLYLGELGMLETGATLWPDWIVESDYIRARVHHVSGREDEAASMFRSVIRDAVEIGFQMAVVDSLDALAAIEGRRDVLGAARLVGMADRLRAETGLRVLAPAEHRQTVAALTDALGQERYDRVYAEGHAMRWSAIVDAVVERS
jgi:predicted ATPase/DNA-binding SARP family transcriptional activator